MVKVALNTGSISSSYELNATENGHFHSYNTTHAFIDLVVYSVKIISVKIEWYQSVRYLLYIIELEMFFLS